MRGGGLQVGGLSLKGVCGVFLFWMEVGEGRAPWSGSGMVHLRWQRAVTCVCVLGEGDVLGLWLWAACCCRDWVPLAGQVLISYKRLTVCMKLVTDSTPPLARTLASAAVNKCVLCEQSSLIHCWIAFVHNNTQTNTHATSLDPASGPS